jgi:uncharacterized protein YhaN
MRIRTIHIEQFGACRDQDVSVVQRGMTVLYGPNEAGKSTVMRCVRRLLFGFRPEDEAGPGPRPRRVACAGRLDFTDSRGDYVLRRESEFGTRGRVTLTHGSDGPVSPALLQELLRGISEAVYEHIFAVGLDELQQLATLQDEDVARHVFDMTLGPDGERVVAACRTAELFRSQLWDEAHDSGEMRILARELDEIDRGIAALGDPLADYRRLQSDSRRMEAEILDQQQRLHGLQEQLSGHLFLERVWGPWNRQQQLLRERVALAVRVEFPEDGVERLDRLSREIAQHRRQRRAVRREAREAAREAAGLVPDVRLEEHAPRVRRLLERSSSIAALRSGLVSRQQQAESHRREMAERQKRLGSSWSEQRLAAVGGSPAAASKLCAQAQAYRLALVRRSWYTRRYQRLAALVQQEQAEHAEHLRAFGGRDFDEAYEELTGRAAALRRAAQLQARTDAADAAFEMLQHHRQSVRRPRNLPPYYYGVLGLFGVGGALLMLLGLFDVVHTIRGGPAPWQVGAVFLLLGTCCAAVTWTMRRQFEPPAGLQQEVDVQLASVEAGFSDARKELEILREQLLEHPPAETDEHVGFEAPFSPREIQELDAQLRQRLADLAHLERCDQALRERRQRLSRMRGRLREYQRGVSEARRAWCTLLKEVGLDESVRIRPTIEAWQLAAEARELQRLWALDREAISHDEHQVREFDAEIARLAPDIDGNDAPDQEPAERLAGWQHRLEVGAAARARRRSLLSTVRARRRDAGRHAACIRQLDAARFKLLASVGVASPEEFRELHRRCVQLRELDQQLEQVGMELSAVARTEPTLAIVEDDLVRFDAARNRHAVEMIRAELADLERDLRASHEHLGRQRQEIQSREADRTLARLRCDRAQLAADLDRAVHRFCAAELAARVLETLRDRLERKCQPETLTRAARYFARLTAGKYTRVWTPAGERRLIIDDDRRQSLRVEQLSSGTREQLFLAIRLALLEQYRDRGVDLPIVLDDVIANFDQIRTEAAVETLVDFAAGGGQVLLFTCHLHLARLFEEAGVAPVRLPEPEPLLERRRVG